MAEQDALKLIFLRNQHYRRLYLSALGVFVLSVITIGFLVGTIVFIKRNVSHPLYFATDSIGRLIPVVPVDRPNMTDDEVMAWAVEAVQKIYSYDFVNYHAQLQGAQKYFTAYGWMNYLRALTASNNVIALTERKMVVIAQVVSTPQLVMRGLLGGAYAWKWTMPVLVTYWLPPYDDKSKFTNPLAVTVIIQRQSVLQSYRGLGVVQIIGNSAAGTGVSQPSTLSNAPT